jgi:hypothetical protein
MSMYQSVANDGGSVGNNVPFVRLKVDPGLRGVTKLQWRTWPTRTWLSWVIGGLFITGAVTLIYVSSRTGAAEPDWHRSVRYGCTAALAIVVVTRLILEATVLRPQPGTAPPWDKRFADWAWTPIHTFAGFVMGLWLAPFVVVAGLTVAWEVLEISVPGFGDEEINGNRLTDITVAWLGWGAAAALTAAACHQALPFL